MIGRLITRAPRRILGAGLVLFVLAGALAAGVLDALSLNRFEAPDSESVAARELLGEQFGTSTPNVAVLVTAPEGTVDDADVAGAGSELTALLAEHPDIGDAWSYWTPGAPDTLRSDDARHGLILGWAPGDADHVRGTVLPGLEDELESADSELTAVDVQLGGSDEIFRVTAEEAAADFIRAEIVIVPLVGVLLWAVYRRAAPALVTLGLGIFTVVGTLALLWAFTRVTEISTFASNIALVMGIGLGVDYGLFMVYRFREELTRRVDVADAVRAAVASAGRTVMFSGLTVAASLAVLFVFPYPFLSSFAYAGIAVVLTAVFGATVLLPAALVLVGRRVVRRGSPDATDPAAATDDEQRFWFRLPAAVMRRPILAGGLALVALLGLGAPALGINFGSPDERVLPDGLAVREMYDTIRDDFTTEDADAVYVVAPDAGSGRLAGYAAALSELPGVERVDSAAGSYIRGDALPSRPFHERFTGDDGTGTWLTVIPTGERLAEDPAGLVDEVRATPAPFDVLVGGYPAELADYNDGVVDRLPLLAGLIVAVTFVVLFLMTGSVVAPIKASVLNLLSLSVMFGVLVWGFQEGGLADLLGFTPSGAVEPSIPLLMFCIAYGLSMDYEVFLLSRIKEDYDRTGDAAGSVPRGIARSAPLVTAAAVILAVSFSIYATSGIVFLQQLGIGIALVILVDATLIRGVLVPAFMRLAGRANWWAPEPLRRLHRRVGLREEPAAEPAPAVVGAVTPHSAVATERR
ncbi:MMPL family transporter [Phytoactinopolyspora halotolerans]|uniref:MMPL family transporter n=1 Tax=Phytoactinopolyspora halotolerans TaxID=1981512 RepID=A0A6L9SER1_9ACTN|nr:MMPL family transporter [Phytoactinopolyspora halotolerans]NEE03144.1 MMPL family transporter [Phytoactinopolyspora halotolerans]